MQEISSDEFRELWAKVQELRRSIENVPPGQSFVMEGSLLGNLDYLGLVLKYLIFDVEATRREALYLRKMLEEAHGDTP